MSAEVRNDAFEGFFTTEGIRSTGMGHWDSRSIVDKYKGWPQIRLSVHAGQSGTAFSLLHV